MAAPQERVTLWQSFVLLTGFLFGTSTLVLPVSGARQDGWISLVMAQAAAIGLAWLWTRMDAWYPRNGWVGHLRMAWGRYLGTALGLLYAWYTLHLTALMIRELAELYTVAIFPEIPPALFVVGSLVPVALASFYGWENIHRFAEAVVFPVLAVVVAETVLALITPGAAHWEFLAPVLEHGWVPVLQSSAAVVAFPFTEAFLFTVASSRLTRPDLAFKPLWRAMVLSGILLLAAYVRSVVVLGPEELLRSTFPSLESTRVINLAEFVQRLDILLVLGWNGGVILKASAALHLCLLSLQDSLGLKDFRPLIMPLVVLAGALSILVFASFDELISFLRSFFPAYALMYQVVLPLLTLVVLAVRRPGTKRAVAGTGGGAQGPDTADARPLAARPGRTGSAPTAGGSGPTAAGPGPQPAECGAAQVGMAPD